MLWVALATAISLLTGDGDDTAAFRAMVAYLQARVQSSVSDPERLQRALAAVDQTSDAFAAHRDGLQQLGSCLERLDRSYQVSAADYAACDTGTDELWRDTTQKILAARHALVDAVTPEEWQQIAAHGEGDPR